MKLLPFDWAMAAGINPMQIAMSINSTLDSHANGREIPSPLSHGMKLKLLAIAGLAVANGYIQSDQAGCFPIHMP